MPYRWDCGWGGAVLLFCFVLLPALALLVRRKWRLAEARRAEIMRLVRLAAAEAERAEREAAVFASASDPPASVVMGGGTVMSKCSVCHSPTTTRCARCKVVKYCSGKCQIIHWRSGHKNACHPPPVCQFKARPYVANLKGVRVESLEKSDNWSENDAHNRRNDDPNSAYQNVLTVEAGQHEETIFGNNRSVIKGEPDVVESLETSFNSETTSQIGNIRNKPSASTSGKERFATSLLPSSASTDITLLGSEEMSDVASNTSPPGAEPGQHSTASSSYISFDNKGKSSSSATLESCRTSANTFCNSSSDDFKLQPTFMNVEAKCRFNGPSNMKSCSSKRSLDVQLCQNCNDPKTASLTKTLDEFENFKFSENNSECQEIAVEIVRSADSTESHTPCNSSQTQLDSKLHSNGYVRDSNPKSFSPTASPVRLELTETKDLCNEKSFSIAYGEKNNEQLSSPLEDHDSLVSRKSLEISDSLLNGKVLVEEGVKQISSSSLRHAQTGVYNCGSLKYNFKMLFSYDLFIKLYNSDKVGLNPCGLINCGNSCYVNVVLQCLAFTRPLAAYLLEGLHAKACSKKEWCFTCALENLLMKANQEKSALSPVGIISHIHAIGSSFSQGREEDAHEFLRHAINAMQSACLKEAGPNAVAELAQETTLIQLIFGGYLHSKIKCMRCKGKSGRRERMMDLTVEMHGDIETLEEALARFTATEVMEGENKYKCGRCKSYEQAKKQLTILEAPNVLTIALKRYQSGKFVKLNKMVRFPEYLNLAPYMRGSDDKSPVYRLYAIVVHNDVMNAAFSGHYVCYVKNAVGKWFKADDSVVKQVEVQAVLSQGAYLLFYARCSPRAPSLLRKEIADKTRLIKQNGDSHSSKAKSSSKISRPKLTVTYQGKNQASHSYDPKLFRPHDLFHERLRRSELDVSSDSSSLFSCSDEGSSWSAESTKESATTEDFAESVNGEPGHINCNSPLRFSEDSDGFTCSPNPNGKMLESPDLSPLDSRMGKGIGRGVGAGLQGMEKLPFLHSSKHCRNLTEQCSSSETDWVSSSELKPSVLSKRSSRDTAAQTFY